MAPLVRAERILQPDCNVLTSWLPAYLAGPGSGSRLPGPEGQRYYDWAWIAPRP